MNKKTVILVITLVLLAVGSALAFRYHAGPHSPTTEKGNETSETASNLPEEKRRAVDRDGSSEEGAQNHNISIILNSFGQSNGTVYANATVSSAETGTCEFRFERNGSSFTEAAPIERAPTGYYACGVRIDAARFTPKGAWKARVHVKDTDPKIESDVKEATVK